MATLGWSGPRAFSWIPSARQKLISVSFRKPKAISAWPRMLTKEPSIVAPIQILVLPLESARIKLFADLFLPTHQRHAVMGQDLS